MYVYTEVSTEISQFNLLPHSLVSHAQHGASCFFMMQGDRTNTA